MEKTQDTKQLQKKEMGTTEQQSLWPHISLV